MLTHRWVLADLNKIEDVLVAENRKGHCFSLSNEIAAAGDDESTSALSLGIRLSNTSRFVRALSDVHSSS
jgi:hypothetical protein